MTVKKKLIIAAVAILSVYAIINVVWFSTEWRKYNNFIENLEEVTEPEGNKRIRDGYFIWIRRPSYLDFSGDGEISVSNAKSYEAIRLEDGSFTSNMDMYIGVSIFPRFWGGYDIRVTFEDVTNDIDIFRIDLDSDLKYIPQNSMDKLYNDEIETLIEENEDVIKEMFDCCIEAVGL